MKMTPKSCSCTACRHGKGSTVGKLRMRLAERAFRHASNRAIRQGTETDPLPAPKGGHFD